MGLFTLKKLSFKLTRVGERPQTSVKAVYLQCWLPEGVHISPVNIHRSWIMLYLCCSALRNTLYLFASFQSTILKCNLPLGGRAIKCCINMLHICCNIRWKTTVVRIHVIITIYKYRWWYLNVIMIVYNHPNGRKVSCLNNVCAYFEWL